MKLKLLSIFFLSFLFAFCEAPGKGKNNLNLTTVESLDIHRYMGRWFEIARLPHYHERGLHSITANYSLAQDGTISVTNRGYSQNETLKEARGKAYRPDDLVPGELKVSFFWIFYGDYLVIELDTDYQWALVSAGSGEYLWILSRTPVMNEAIYQDILQRARKRGFDLGELIVVEQKRVD